jgi:ssDNA thymidine ADP-ribosyltransferase, DarT
LERDELSELHYITHLTNLSSILEHGLVSHRRAAKLAHESVANPQVQELRSAVRVPGGRPLHDYVNLYMTARNPMLYKLARHDGYLHDLAVVEVSSSVLDIEGVVVTDMNAAASLCRFYSAPDGLAHVDSDRVFRRFWNEGDDIERKRCKKAKCAEVLVPDRVGPEYFEGIKVASPGAKAAARKLENSLVVSEDADLFFS